MEFYGRSYCKFCSATPCPASCSSTSSPHWLCSGCLCPATTGCPTLSCGNTCSTGIWQTTTYPGYECPYCTCSYTTPATPCPLVSCSGPCRPAPQCGMTGYQTATYLPGSSCPSCACTVGVVCSVLPCNGPCSTGSLSYTTGVCSPPGCWGCSCHPVTTPCKTETGCSGQCEGGTLGMATVEGCSTRCPEYCDCKPTALVSTIGRGADVKVTPTLTTVGMVMTGVVMVVPTAGPGFKVEERRTAFEPVTTTRTA
ncbi:hypothetical protein FA13DRAFT_142576 [Coprinellus micaceus]|uniref:Uncharacterized protein n=1 Tax=Coprinellus micaceus TaxID=71717 RepID=A0A4Y7SHB8_COPMI|nr:hypothetical protein FA13DRAFT_142576 [Coprinellus micaceus]